MSVEAITSYLILPYFITGTWYTYVAKQIEVMSVYGNLIHTTKCAQYVYVTLLRNT